MIEEPIRSQSARAAAQLALVRVAHHYGGRPEFVLLGGLVPALLCHGAPVPHAGTTDVDVQVNLEIQKSAANAARLEQALGNAEFSPDENRVWRWKQRNPDGTGAVVKFELLADLDNEQAGATISFDNCRHLGAVNLRGTGYAARDITQLPIQAKDGGVLRTVELNVTGLGGFLMAKAAAAYGRSKPKDWYDIAYVLLHNTVGGPAQAAAAVRQRFGPVATDNATQTWFVELASNFVDDDAQGTNAFVDQVLVDDPETDPSTAATDARLAVGLFIAALR